MDCIQTSQVAFFQSINQKRASPGYKWHCVKTKVPSECLKGSASLSCYIRKRFLFAFVSTKSTKFHMGRNIYTYNFSLIYTYSFIRHIFIKPLLRARHIVSSCYCHARCFVMINIMMTKTWSLSL